MQIVLCPFVYIYLQTDLKRKHTHIFVKEMTFKISYIISKKILLGPLQIVFPELNILFLYYFKAAFIASSYCYRFGW